MSCSHDIGVRWLCCTLPLTLFLGSVAPSCCGILGAETELQVIRWVSKFSCSCHSLICGKRGKHRCSPKWIERQQSKHARSYMECTLWWSHTQTNCVCPPKFAHLWCRLLPLASFESPSEQNGCFVKPPRLKQRQVTPLIRLPGLFCHRGLGW